MALLLNSRVSVCAEGGHQIWCSRNERTSRDWFVKESATQFLDPNKGYALLHVTYLQAMLHRKRLEANSRYEGDKQKQAEEGGRRRKNVLLDAFGVGQFFKFLIFPAPALQLPKLLIALVLDLCLPSICLLGETASEGSDHSTEYVHS